MNTSQIKEIVKKSVADAVVIAGTQVALAKRAHITQGAIGKYLRGDSIPSGLTAKHLSEAVDGRIPPSGFAPHIFD